MLLPLPLQERPQHRALGRLVGDVNDSGEPSAMDEGELPVDANGEVVSGDPVDPNDPRVTSQRPAGRSLVSFERAGGFFALFAVLQLWPEGAAMAHLAVAPAGSANIGAGRVPFAPAAFVSLAKT